MFFNQTQAQEWRVNHCSKKQKEKERRKKIKKSKSLKILISTHARARMSQNVMLVARTAKLHFRPD